MFWLCVTRHSSKLYVSARSAISSICAELASARDAANRLQADNRDRIAGLFVRMGILVEPDGEIGVGAVDIVGPAGFKRRVFEIGLDAFELGGGER